MTRALNEKTSDRTEVRYDPKTEAFFYEVFHGNEHERRPVQFFPRRLTTREGSEMIARLVGLALAVTVVTPAVANLQLQPGCNNFSYSSAQIAGAIRTSRFATLILQFAACDFGAAALAESGGNTCASNGSNFGVLQLNNTNLPYGVTSDAYLALPMDKQVDVWALQVGKSNAADGYQTLARDKAQGQTVGGTAVTSGMLKACFQFGPGICYNDIRIR